MHHRATLSSNRTGARRHIVTRYLMLVAGVAAIPLLTAWLAAPRAHSDAPRPNTVFGQAVAVGAGSVRVFLTSQDGIPLALGVAMTESVLTGPAPTAKGQQFHHHVTHEFVVDMPVENTTPFQHVLFNWNPMGHEPPGIYDRAHFDFHFYLTDNAERVAIDPADPEFAIKAARYPIAEEIPAGYVSPSPDGFPQMGVHWIDAASPEFHGEPFSHTFIYGSWDGRITFVEPMITREFLTSKADVTASVPVPDQVKVPGYYPSAYRVYFDATTREHRLELLEFVWR